MKRLICILLAAILCLPLFSVAASGEECEHNMRDTDAYRQTWVSCDELHQKVYQRMMCCTLCGCPAWRQVKLIIEGEPLASSSSRYDGTECSHNFLSTNEQRIVWITTSISHTQVVQQKQTCTSCHSSCWLQLDILHASSIHNLCISSIGHDHSTTTHSYLLHCATCGYSRSETIICNGPPCPEYPAN